MTSSTTERFRGAFALLPEHIQGDALIWFWIGTHADYDGLLRQL